MNTGIQKSICVEKFRDLTGLWLSDLSSPRLEPVQEINRLRFSRIVTLGSGDSLPSLKIRTTEHSSHLNADVGLAWKSHCRAQNIV